MGAQFIGDAIRRRPTLMAPLLRAPWLKKPAAARSLGKCARAGERRKEKKNTTSKENDLKLYYSGAETEGRMTFSSLLGRVIARPGCVLCVGRVFSLVCCFLHRLMLGTPFCAASDARHPSHASFDSNEILMSSPRTTTTTRRTAKTHALQGSAH